MRVLILKDTCLSRLPIIASVALLITPYVVASMMTAHTYWPEWPSLATVADTLMTAAVFGLLLSTVSAGLLAGNMFACERADGSAVFLACQPVSKRRVALSKAIVLGGVMGMIWLIHGLFLMVIAPGLEGEAAPYIDLGHPLGFAAATVIVAAGVGWVASIVMTSSAMATSTALAATFFLPWFVYLCSLGFDSIAPDQLRAITTGVQWSAGLGGFLLGTLIFLKRVEP